MPDDYLCSTFKTVISKTWYICIHTMCNFWRCTLTQHSLNSYPSWYMYQQNIPLNCWMLFHRMCVQELNHPSIRGYLGCCQFGVFTQEAAMKFFCVPVLEWSHAVLWGKTPRIGIVGILPLSHSIFNLWRDPQIAFQRRYTISHSCWRTSVISFSATSPVFGGGKTDWQKWLYTEEGF